jgi:hypothetical protein
MRVLLELVLYPLYLEDDLSEPDLELSFLDKSLEEESFKEILDLFFTSLL